MNGVGLTPFDRLRAHDGVLRADDRMFWPHVRMIMDGICEPLGEIRMAGPMHMQVARVQCLPASPGGIGGQADRLTIDQPGRSYARLRLNHGAVELVTGQSSPSSR